MSIAPGGIIILLYYIVDTHIIVIIYNIIRRNNASRKGYLLCVKGIVRYYNAYISRRRVWKGGKNGFRSCRRPRRVMCTM